MYPTSEEGKRQHVPHGGQHTHGWAFHEENYSSEEALDELDLHHLRSNAFP